MAEALSVNELGRQFNGVGSYFDTICQSQPPPQLPNDLNISINTALIPCEISFMALDRVNLKT